MRSKLRQKSQTVDNMHNSNDHISDDLYSVIEESRAKRVESTSIRPHLKPRGVDLRDQLNSKSEDLRIKLNRPKRSDLRRKLEETRAKTDDKQEPIVQDSSSDLRIQLHNKWAERAPFLNVIMGGSPPCGDSVQSIKDYQRQAVTSKKWPSKPENDHRSLSRLTMPSASTYLIMTLYLLSWES